jgi:hypothetical protein
MAKSAKTTERALVLAHPTVEKIMKSKLLKPSEKKALVDTLTAHAVAATDPTKPRQPCTR